MGGLARTALSDYSRLRSSLGLTMYKPDDMLDRLRRAGFEARREANNIGHNPARMTFLAERV